MSQHDDASAGVGSFDCPSGPPIAKTTVRGNQIRLDVARVQIREDSAAWSDPEPDLSPAKHEIEEVQSVQPAEVVPYSKEVSFV